MSRVPSFVECNREQEVRAAVLKLPDQAKREEVVELMWKLNRGPTLRAVVQCGQWTRLQLEPDNPTLPPLQLLVSRDSTESDIVRLIDETRPRVRVRAREEPVATPPEDLRLETWPPARPDASAGPGPVPDPFLGQRLTPNRDELRSLTGLEPVEFTEGTVWADLPGQGARGLIVAVLNTPDGAVPLVLDHLAVESEPVEPSLSGGRRRAQQIRSIIIRKAKELRVK